MKRILLTIFCCYLAISSLAKGPEDSICTNQEENAISYQAFMLNSLVITEHPASPEEMLHKAILNDSPEEIIEALNGGANINQGKDGKPPILLAVLLKKSNAIESLVQCGANVDVSYAGYSLVLHAVRLYDIRSALVLVKTGSKFSGYIDDIKRNVMDYVVGGGSGGNDPLYLEFIQELINRGYNIHSSHWNTNIFYCLLRKGGGSTEVIKLFLNNDVDPNQIIDTSQLITGSSWTPLMLAVSSGDKETIEILISAGADLNSQANPYPHRNGPHTPLSFAIEYKKDMIEFLIEKDFPL
ncbi:hypothetical protein LCGC14_1027860 [marine sediment metagenome]|uniref:Uncharacterized protein n=1 Tax=marine sediment metagenome TaxID=412755 RepID=A0A0F9MVK0_9ZZZZ|nr:ankyrin repeat domain-containing protein [Candidatus Aminicenantes bacterium]